MENTTFLEYAPIITQKRKGGNEMTKRPKDQVKEKLEEIGKNAEELDDATAEKMAYWLDGALAAMRMRQEASA